MVVLQTERRSKNCIIHHAVTELIPFWHVHTIDILHIILVLVEILPDYCSLLCGLVRVEASIGVDVGINVRGWLVILVWLLGEVRPIYLLM